MKWLLPTSVICILILLDFNVEARIGWAGGGRGSWKPNLRPMEPDFWDSKYDKDYYDWDQADENMMEKYKNSKLGARGCVGLCLYNKIHDIKEINPSPEQKNIEILETATKLSSIYTYPRPCVGLCQYYKARGMPYPFANERKLFS